MGEFDKSDNFGHDPRKRPTEVSVSTPETDAVEFARTRLGFEPDEKQAAVLRSTAKQGILNCTRQWGKSTVTAAKAVHHAYTRPGALVIVAGPALRQTREFLRKVRQMTQNLGVPCRRDGDNAASLLFPNDSRIIALPGREDTVRGFSAVSLLLVDEASRVDDGLYDALQPMLATTNGDLWLMSTPRGRRGFFYEAWEHGGPEWERISVPVTECPRIAPEYVERQQRRMVDAMFRQEFLCEFQDDERNAFDVDLIDAAFDENVTPYDLGR